VVRSYTAKYTRISSGYMGQLVEWPEVITEGDTIEECRTMLRDALQEMVEAYKQQGKEIPPIQMAPKQYRSRDIAHLIE
jgi:predicted RNase H-like HicB family nuclease